MNLDDQLGLLQSTGEFLILALELAVLLGQGMDDRLRPALFGGQRFQGACSTELNRALGALRSTTAVSGSALRKFL